uniref:Uncharacterized protein n=1 Tax=Rhizophagus irregularis (strain DAOM 181602 / DAOM 197198 / MUCL 43194) TaxID=747089 RepID=U9UM03_RHIID
MSLSSTDEPVLQVIVENFLPLKYCVPELALVINGKKPKGSEKILKKLQHAKYWK